MSSTTDNHHKRNGHTEIHVVLVGADWTHEVAAPIAADSIERTLKAMFHKTTWEVRSPEVYRPGGVMPEEAVEELPHKEDVTALQVDEEGTDALPS